MCEGLDEAHSAGLIHRDLKPANLFAAHLGRQCDVAKVLDFGLVKDTTLASAGLVPEEEAVGTLSYIAPEQRSHEPELDHRADLFAACAVAYSLLTACLASADEHGVRPLVAPGPAWAIPPSRHRPYAPLTWSESSCAAWRRAPRTATPMPRACGTPWRPAWPPASGTHGRRCSGGRELNSSDKSRTLDINCC